MKNIIFYILLGLVILVLLLGSAFIFFKLLPWLEQNTEIAYLIFFLTLPFGCALWLKERREERRKRTELEQQRLKEQREAEAAWQLFCAMVANASSELGQLVRQESNFSCFIDDKGSHTRSSIERCARDCRKVYSAFLNA